MPSWSEIARGAVILLVIVSAIVGLHWTLGDSDQLQLRIGGDCPTSQVR